MKTLVENKIETYFTPNRNIGGKCSPRLQKIEIDSILSSSNKNLFNLFKQCAYWDDALFRNDSAAGELMDKTININQPDLDGLWGRMMNWEFVSKWKAVDKLILTPEDEKIVFLQYNYAKSRIASVFVKCRNSGRKIRPHEVKYVNHWGKMVKQTRDIAVVANMGLIVNVFRLMGLFTNPDMADFFSIGIQGLLRGVDGFNVSRGYKFSTYGTRAIWQSIVRYKKELAKKHIEYSNIGGEEYDFSIADIAVAPKTGDVEGVIDLEKLLESKLVNLTREEKLVLRARFWDDKKLHEVGKQLKVTRERIRQIQDKALDRLRVFMDKKVEKVNISFE